MFKCNQMQNVMKQVFALIGVFACMFLHAQIIINTGNPAVQKYKSENPNAVIWEPGAPIPVNVAKESVTKQPKPTVKEAPPASVKQPITPVEEKKTTAPKVVEKETESKDVKAVTPAGPPDAVPGKCYAQVPVKDEYEYYEVQVLDKPATKKITKVPAKYITVYDTIIVKPAVVKRVEVPAVYETVMEKVLVSPATQKWVQGKSNPDCKSPNPKDCEVWTLEEVPAVYKTVPQRVEKSPALVKEEVTPAETKVMPRSKLAEPAKEEEIEVPATYKTVIQKRLIKKGEGLEWKEVPCKPEAASNKILRVQKALMREGYDPGTPDNRMGTKTQDAIAKFQKDKGLPAGGLNEETLKALGVE